MFLNHWHLYFMAGILKSECCLVNIQGIPAQNQVDQTFVSHENHGKLLSPFSSQILLQLIHHSLILMQLTLHLKVPLMILS